MQIVIDIPDKVYGLIKYFESALDNDYKTGDDVGAILIKAVLNGTSLPEGAEILTKEAYSDLCRRAADVPDTNVGELISRQDAIDALWKALYEYEDKTEKQFIESDELNVADWIEHRIFVQNMSDIDRQTILALPSAWPEKRTEETHETHACVCISRDAAIDAVETIGFDFSDSDLSEVELEEVCEAIGEVRQTWSQRIKRLPPVEPERKPGKWIDGKCNKCGANAPFWPMATTYYCSEYCPKCGAKMEVDG